MLASGEPQVAEQAVVRPCTPGALPGPRRVTLWSGFVDDVEGCLGCPAESREATRGNNVTNPRLAGLRAKCESNLL